MKRKFVFFIAGMIFAVLGMAQTTNDFGIWSSAGASKDLGNKWSVSGEIENRTRDNSSEISRWGVQLGAEYKLWKPLTVGLAYQFQYYHDMKYFDFQQRNRFIGYLQGKHKWNNFSFSLRERFQITTKDESDRIKASGKIDDYKINPEWIWRNRFKVAYNIPSCRFTPAFSIETFYELNNPDGNQFEGLRYTLSVEYKMSKRSSLELSGIYDKEVNTDEPTNRTVIGIGYSHKFK
ncbi:MAG: hypothetical protein H6Q14_179 [Bacteroidetes bacterium]|nr:hypothetical protein [Bacteroidota bacterium]